MAPKSDHNAGIWGAARIGAGKITGMSNSFTLEIMACNRSFYAGQAVIVNLPTTEGRIGVMAHHANTIMAIVPGELDYIGVDTNGNEMERSYAAVSNGIIKIENNTVVILVESCETPEEIDVNKVLREEAEAKEAMLQKRSKREYLAARAELARAMNRLAVAKRK